MISIEISALGKSSLKEVSEFVLFLGHIDVLQKFISTIEKTAANLQKNPSMGKPFSKNIRKIILHKNASMFYEFDEEKQIIIILLLSTTVKTQKII